MRSHGRKERPPPSESASTAASPVWKDTTTLEIVTVSVVIRCPLVMMQEGKYRSPPHGDVGKERRVDLLLSNETGRTGSAAGL